MIAAVIPVKRLSEAKSRLSATLSPHERASVVVALLRRTVAVLQEVNAIDCIAVATEEQEMVESLPGVEWLPDTGGLNHSLSHAASWAAQMSARSVLMLPCDLPVLDGGDVLALLEAGGAPPAVTIAPTRDGGTGAILVSPPQAIAPAFGPHSYRRHVEKARRAGIPVRTVTRYGFALELDTSADLHYLDAHMPGLNSITT